MSSHILASLLILASLSATNAWGSLQLQLQMQQAHQKNCADLLAGVDTPVTRQWKEEFRISGAEDLSSKERKQLKSWIMASFKHERGMNIRDMSVSSNSEGSLQLDFRKDEFLVVRHSPTLYWEVNETKRRKGYKSYHEPTPPAIFRALSTVRRTELTIDPNNNSTVSILMDDPLAAKYFERMLERHFKSVANPTMARGPYIKFRGDYTDSRLDDGRFRLDVRGESGSAEQEQSLTLSLLEELNLRLLSLEGTPEEMIPAISFGE